jgi:hypothetical protein
MAKPRATHSGRIIKDNTEHDRELSNENQCRVIELLDE